MTLRLRSHRKWKTRRKLARRSLIKCKKCCHVARNHFQLRYHLKRYHRLSQNVERVSKHKKVSVDKKKSSFECNNGILRGALKASLFPSKQDVKVKPEKLKTSRKTTSVYVKKEQVPKGDRKKSKTNEVVLSTGRMTRSSGRTERVSKPKNWTEKTKTKRSTSQAGTKPKRNPKKSVRFLQPCPCTLCDYVGRDTFNLRRHLQSKHEPKPPKEEKIYRCEQCEYKSRHRFLVKRHSAVHSREQLKGDSSLFACNKCNYVSASVGNLKRHQACRHEKVKEAKLQCSLCDHREPDRPTLFGHFREDHGVIIETERLDFDDFEAFMEFKADTERATFARFVRQQTRMGRKKHVIFKCHRDGIFKSKSRAGERKRALKTTGSNKINSACPASMRVTMDPSGKVSVVFTKTHVGHSNEVCRLTLTKEEKMLIAEMLESKRTFQEILCEIRNGMESKRLERIHLLTRKDLQNIERWYKTREIKEEEPPRTSIDINIEEWVDKIRETKVVRLYKKPATILPKPFKCLDYDDFILILANDLQLAMLRQYGNECICIDNAYDSSHLKLTTLLVLENSRQGFPCAFMLSSKIDKTIMKVFFDVIRKASDCPLTPSILISDIPDYRRTEWAAVMDLPESTEVLYSPWSVHEDLQKNLHKVKREDKRQEVFEIVKQLMLEKNSSNMSHLIDKTVKLLEEDTSTELFGKYFKSKFADTYQKWALCCRKLLQAEDSDHLESTHEILRFVYAEGQKNQRLVDCITVLMTYSRDQMQDRIVLQDQDSLEEAGDKGKLMKSITKRHGDADEMQTLPADPGVYEIMEHNLHCRCGLRCIKCDVCIHSYRCTCSDSILGWNICQHIHFCVISNPSETETNSASQFDPSEEKRKLLLEFENMCDDIAADSVEEKVDEAVVGGFEEAHEEPEQKPVDCEIDPSSLVQSEQNCSLELEDVKSKLQWRFQSICQRVASDFDVTLVEHALASLENALTSRQTNVG